MQIWKSDSAIASFVEGIVVVTSKYSKVIDTIVWYASTNTMYITFHSGSEYCYKNISMTAFMECLDADSLGVWFNENIKDKYECVELSNA
jgi:hypothetical protein